MTNACEPARRRLFNFNYVFSPLVKLNLFHVCHILPSNPFNKHISINIEFFSIQLNRSRAPRVLRGAPGVYAILRMNS